MANLPTPADLASAAQRVLRDKLDPDGTGKVKLATGSRLDAAVSVNVGLSKRVLASVADRDSAGSMKTSRGDDLTIRAAELYNSFAKPASAATTTVYLVRTGTAQTLVPAGTRFAVVQTALQPGVFFAPSLDIPVAAGQLSVAVPVTCTQLGQVGNVDHDLITQVVDPMPDSTWALYEPGPSDAVLAGGSIDNVAGGDEAETEDAFRARTLLGSFDSAKSKGVYAAIVSAVLAVQGIASCVVVEPLDGTIVVFCGDVNFKISAALSIAVQNALNAARTYGTPARVRPFNVIKVPISMTIYMSRPTVNYDVSQIQASGVAQTVTYFKLRSHTDEYFVALIEAAGAKAHPEVQDVILAAPASDQLRPADSAYASASQINRYVVDTSLISIAVAGPRTT